MRNLFSGGDGSRGKREGGRDRILGIRADGRSCFSFLQTNESLRVLDIGPTSSTNINLVTGLGHSIYMANLVEDAAKPEWMSTPSPGDAPAFEVERFLASNFSFSGRMFDVVIFWDTLDYLPTSSGCTHAGGVAAVHAPRRAVVGVFSLEDYPGECAMETDSIDII